MSHFHIRDKWYQSRPILGRASAAIDLNFETQQELIESICEKVKEGLDSILQQIKIESQEMKSAMIMQGEKLKLLAENVKLLKKEYNKADDEDDSSGEDDLAGKDLMSEEQKVFDKMPDPKLRNAASIKLSEMIVVVNNRGKDKQFAAKEAFTAVFVKMKGQGYLGSTVGSEEPIHNVVVFDFEKISPNFGEKNILLFDPGGTSVTPLSEFKNSGTVVLSDTIVVSNNDFAINRATMLNRHKLFDEMSQIQSMKKGQIGIAFGFDKDAFNIIGENVIIFDPVGVVLSDVPYGNVDTLEPHIIKVVTRMDKHMLDAICCLKNERNVLIFETTLFRQVFLDVQNLGAEVDNMHAPVCFYCNVPHVDISEMQSIYQGLEGQLVRKYNLEGNQQLEATAWEIAGIHCCHDISTHEAPPCNLKEPWSSSSCARALDFCVLIEEYMKRNYASNQAEYYTIISSIATQRMPYLWLDVCDVMMLGGMKPERDTFHSRIVGSLCYDFSNPEEYLNQKSVKDALGVGDIEFVFCSPFVYQVMLMDRVRNLEAGIPTLLEDGVKLLVYAGEYNLICNWLGNSRWVDAKEYSGQKEFVLSPEVSFQVAGVLLEMLETHKREFPFEGSAPSVVIHHLQSQAEDCSHLSFGSFGAAISALYSSGTMTFVPLQTNLEGGHSKDDNSSAAYWEYLQNLYKQLEIRRVHNFDKYDICANSTEVLCPIYQALDVKILPTCYKLMRRPPPKPPPTMIEKAMT